MKDKMILKDGTIIDLEAGASIGNLQVAASSCREMAGVWEKLSIDNLKEVKIQNGSGLTVGIYEDLVLVSETSVILENGTVLTNYCMRQKTIVEKKLEEIQEGQETQNDAIGDLGAVTSMMAERLGVGIN